MTKCNYRSAPEEEDEQFLDPNLAQNSLFKNVTEESIGQILVCSGAKMHTYKKNETIFCQGDKADYFYAVLKGTVSVICYMPSGKVNALYHVASGALLGEHYSSHLATKGRVYWYEAVACEPVEVLEVPWQYLYSFCDKACDHHKQLIQNLYESMSTKEWMAVRKLNVLGFSSVQERIAAWLLQETDKKGMVELKTNREEQADYLCVARPSLSRTLMQMQKAGIIETRRNQIRILDKEKLEKIL